MTTATKPLPSMGEDPSIIKGQQVRASFAASLQAIRENRSLNTLQVAEQVVATWEDTNSQLSKLYVDLQKRRQARLDVLETLVPLGPAIPAGAGAADTAVLQQAFRSALAEARNLMPARADEPGLASLKSKASLESMLADAERFDDDNLRRAVLTAAFEAGHMQVVRGWTDLMGVTNRLDEYYELQRAVAGQGQAGSWNFTVFSPLRAPAEAAQLPRLQAAEEDAVNARIQDSVNARKYRTL